MDKFKKDIYIPIQKIDDEQHMVYGYASTPDIDSDGEIIKAEALQKALPNYMKFPTIREMHQPKVAGTTKQADATDKGLYIGAYIPVEEAWQKVKEGLYRGFSIGGNVLKRVGNIIHDIELVEISLVDVPANKAAVVEIWKRDKFQKNAYTAYEAAMLMIQLKDMIDWFKWSGKDTTALEDCLETMKSVVATEAQEPEQSHDEPDGDEVMLASKDFYTTKTVSEIEDRIARLQKMDFTHNDLANALRKGVIIAMQKKAKELKKENEVTPETTTPETTTPAPAGEGGEGKDVTPETITPEAETPATETPEKEGEEKEAGSTADTLQKMEDIQKSLDALTPKVKEAEVTKAEKEELSKVVGSMAGALSKMASTLVAMNERVAKLEATPAAPKSKAVTVAKTIGGTTTVPEKEVEVSPEIAKHQARLKELDDLYEKLGANEFAKQGYSMEASKIYSEIDKLSK